MSVEGSGPLMDLKTSAEVEVRKLQDMVKKLEKQNELLRHTQNGGVTRKSLDLEEVALINLNESADDLEESWLYESPVKHATPVQKSVGPLKWMKSARTEGLDDVRKCLIEKLDDIEAQQEISKVRLFQKSEPGRPSLEKDSLFFQPANKTTNNNFDVEQMTRNNHLKLGHNQFQHNQNIDLSDDDFEDGHQAPVLRRSAVNKDTNAQDSSEITFDSSPVFRRTANTVKPRDNLSDFNQSYGREDDSLEDLEDQSPVLPRSAKNIETQRPQETSGITSGSPLVSRRTANTVKSKDILSDGNQFNSKSDESIEDLEEEIQGPILRRSAVNKAGDARSSTSQSQDSNQTGKYSPLEIRRMANSSTATRKSVSPVPDENVRIQPRSRMATPNVRDSGSDDMESSSPNSVDDLDDDDDINNQAPVMKRSTLVLPKPSSEGLSKQLWYSGPVNQMNPQKAKGNPTVARVRRSASPSPDRRSKPQPKSGTAMRRSTGTRGSVEDLLEPKEKASVQRRSLPAIPTDSNGVKSRLAKPDDSLDTKSLIKPRGKLSNSGNNSPTGVVSRRSLATPSSTTKTSNAVVSRRRAAVPRNDGDSYLEDSWKDGCY